jgi:hypothetical protein
LKHPQEIAKLGVELRDGDITQQGFDKKKQKLLAPKRYINYYYGPHCILNYLLS